MHIPIYNDPIYYVTSSDSYLAKAHDIFKLDDLLKDYAFQPLSNHKITNNYRSKV